MANFYDFLERLQRQPDKQKRRFLVLVVGIFAFALLALWIVRLKSELAGQPGLFSLEPAQFESGPEKKQDQSGGEAKARGPLASLGQGLALFISDLREKSEELLSQTSEIVPETTDEQGKRPVWKLPRSK